jgi:hypothetical protein
MALPLRRRTVTQIICYTILLFFSQWFEGFTIRLNGVQWFVIQMGAHETGSVIPLAGDVFDAASQPDKMSRVSQN